MQYVIDFLVYVVIGTTLSWVFFYLKRFDLFGGFLVSSVVAVLSCILGAFLLHPILKPVIDALQNGLYFANVNIIAALIGGAVSLMILSKINNGRKRKDY